MNISRLLIVLLLSINTAQCAQTSFKLGLEAIPQSLITSLQSKRVGLVTNQTGKDQQGKRNLDILRTKNINVTHLFAPEHGIDGTVAAGKTVDSSKDAKTGIPIVSIYKHGTGKAVDKKLLRKIDVFIFDMQDSGMRHYTYVSTLYKLLEIAAQFGKKVIVLDRPNPLGAVMEGPLVEPQFISFIAIAPIPVRHGMTLGELSAYFNKYHFNNKVALTVVGMPGYKRTDTFKKLITPLSPNIASLQSTYGYSFLGLMGEISPFDVAVGTPRAFQCITLPHELNFAPKKLDRLRTIFDQQHITSAWCHYKSDRKNGSFVGLSITIDDPNKVSTVSTLLAILEFFKREGVPLQFKNFDKAMGTTLMREYIEGKTTKKRLVTALQRETQAFYSKAKPFFRYEPYPKIMNL